MLADKVRVSWKLALAGVVALALGARSLTPPTPASAPASQPTWVHVKYASETLAMAAWRQPAMEPLFPTMGLTEHDDRARWIRIEAPDRAAADRLVDKLS